MKGRNRGDEEATNEIFYVKLRQAPTNNENSHPQPISPYENEINTPSTSDQNGPRPNKDLAKDSHISWDSRFAKQSKLKTNDAYEPSSTNLVSDNKTKIIKGPENVTKLGSNKNNVVSKLRQNSPKLLRNIANAAPKRNNGGYEKITQKCSTVSGDVPMSEGHETLSSEIDNSGPPQGLLASIVSHLSPNLSKKLSGQSHISPAAKCQPSLQIIVNKHSLPLREPQRSGSRSNSREPTTRQGKLSPQPLTVPSPRAAVRTRSEEPSAESYSEAKRRIVANSFGVRRFEKRGSCWLPRSPSRDCNDPLDEMEDGERKSNEEKEPPEERLAASALLKTPPSDPPGKLNNNRHTGAIPRNKRYKELDGPILPARRNRRTDLFSLHRGLQTPTPTSATPSRTSATATPHVYHFANNTAASPSIALNNNIMGVNRNQNINAYLKLHEKYVGRQDSEDTYKYEEEELYDFDDTTDFDRYGEGQTSDETNGAKFQGRRSIRRKSAEKRHRKRSMRRRAPKPATSIKQIWIDFCSRTSSHGMPHIAASNYVLGKLFWATVFAFCFFAFVFQTYYTVAKYCRFEKIIEMELKFEPAPFPAVTVCNINPYKNSEVQKIDALRKSMDVYEHTLKHNQMNPRSTPRERHQKTPEQSSEAWGTPPPGSSEERHSEEAGRGRRSTHLEPLYVLCKCQDILREQCVPLRDLYETAYVKCLCFQETNSGTIWPCYHSSVWSRQNCSTCSYSGSCDYPHASLKLPNDIPCLCQNISNSCIIDRFTPISWFRPFDYKTVAQETTTSAPPTTTTPDANIIDSMGISNMTDDIAITTMVKENLVFAVGSLPKDVRVNLSYTKEEFVLKCSFNGQQCNIDLDFLLHLDPIFGNCYIFNWNETHKRTNSRAGPMYGMRLLLNVNQSDYLSSTEMAGVRINVHDQTQYTFPDTFGFNAPTGFVSSFGLRSGCYRSCFQKLILQECFCGDPRFPVPAGLPSCDAEDATARQCIRNVTENAGNFYRMKTKCDCVQPCEEFVFQVTYSAATWPSRSHEVGTCDFIKDNDTNCLDYYKKNTAFLEIYYEQLNYESLREKEAYGIESLLSDLGGNIGLWIGFSIITILEFLILFSEIIIYFCGDEPYRRRMAYKADRYRAAKIEGQKIKVKQQKHLHSMLASQANLTLKLTSDSTSRTDSNYYPVENTLTLRKPSVNRDVPKSTSSKQSLGLTTTTMPQTTPTYLETFQPALSRQKHAQQGKHHRTSFTSPGSAESPSLPPPPPELMTDSPDEREVVCKSDTYVEANDADKSAPMSAL